MKSHIFGGLALVATIATVACYSNVFARLANETKKSGPNYRLYVERDQAQPPFQVQIPLIWPGKAASLTAVGWEGCPACKRFKETTLPALVKEGYKVKYTDKSLWPGPRVTAGPTLYFFNSKGVIIKVYRGTMTPEQVKQWLRK